MKPTLLALSLLFSAGSFAQNLIPNYSFEKKDSCPNNVSNGPNYPDFVEDWYLNPTHKGSPDYYNSCSPNFMGTPVNLMGEQVPHSGQAYIGLYNYNYSGSIDNKEYFSIRLTEPLKREVNYTLIMYVSLSGKSYFATNGLGAKFYENDPAFVNTSQASFGVIGTPQISFSNYGVVSDTTGWVKLQKSFIADSAYKIMLIGGFVKAQSQQTSVSNPQMSGFKYSYYYIDDVMLMETSQLGIDDAKAPSVSVSPNPARSEVVFQFQKQVEGDLVLTSMTGQLVAKASIADSKFILHRNDLPAGVYVYSFTTKDGARTMGKVVFAD